MAAKLLLIPGILISLEGFSQPIAGGRKSPIGWSTILHNIFSGQLIIR